MTSGFQFIAVSGSSPVLPYYCMINWFACAAFPYNCCLALIGDSDTGHLFHCNVGLCHCFRHGAILCTPYFFSIMLHPAGLRKYLLEFFLCNAYNISMFIKNNAAAAGSTLVECKNIIRHLNKLKSQKLKVKRKIVKSWKECL